MNSFISLGNALHWRKLRNHNDEDLPQEDVQKLWGFYNMMKWTRACSFVMRGESNENLMEQFETNANNPALLAKRNSAETAGQETAGQVPVSQKI